MFKKRSNLLDYPKGGLCPDIWDNNLKLKKEIRDLIIGVVKGYLNLYNIDAIEDIYVVGSLTTYQWNNKSDLDVHVVIDSDIYNNFKLLNGIIRKTLNSLGLKVPGTGHQLEFYFEDNKHLQPFDGIYSVLKNKWIKEPITIDNDFNPDVIYKNRLETVQGFIDYFDLKISKIERELKDIDFLKETILMNPDKDYWMSYLNDKIGMVEKEIEDYIEKGEDVIEKRHKNYSREGDSNLLFKYLQRYNYLWLSKQLENILEEGLDADNIDEVKEKIKEFRIGGFMFKKKGQDIPAENENPQSSTAPRGVGVDNSNPSLSTGLSDKGSDSLLFRDRRRPEPEEEENQDKKYQGEATKTVIGDNNVIRECATIHRGTIQDHGITQIGNDNLIMAYVHIAHDCEVGNHCIFANASALAGHVVVGDWAILGGYTLVHQFCHIGAHSFCGMGSVINQDVPNFITVSGNLAGPRGVNMEGLKRRGFDKEQIQLIKKAYRALYRTGRRLEEALVEIECLNDEQGTLSDLIDFLKNSQRGIVR